MAAEETTQARTTPALMSGDERIGLFQAKTQLSRLVNAVTEGKTVTITRHGRPAAALVHPSVVALATRQGPTEAEVARAARAVERWRTYRAAHPLWLNPPGTPEAERLTIRALVEEGRPR